MKPRKQVWVHPDFARMLQRKKGETGLDILDLTERMAKQKERKNDKKRGMFGGGVFEW